MRLSFKYQPFVSGIFFPTPQGFSLYMVGLLIIKMVNRNDTFMISVFFYQASKVIMIWAM